MKMLDVVVKKWREKYQFVMDVNKDLTAALDELKWSQITAKNLPKTGDEIGCYVGTGKMRRWASQGYVEFDGFRTCKEIKHFGWTHRRPTNPPKESK
jgi:hypothetical protein